MRAVGVVGAVLVVVGACGAAVAQDCAAARTTNNPAFGTPRSCATATAAATPAKGKAATSAKKPAVVETENGRTFYRWGETSLAVGGYVAVDGVTGRGRMRP